MSAASVLVVPAHGCQSNALRQSYFLAIYVHGVHGFPCLHFPAVVDDFGSLVVVGGPL